MARLNHSELKALSDTLLGLYSPGPYADLPAKLFAALRRHFACDKYSYDEFDSERAMRAVHEPEFPGALRSSITFWISIPAFLPSSKMASSSL